MAGSNETLTLVAQLVDRVSGPLRAIGARLHAVGNTPYIQRLRGQFQAFGNAIAPIGSLLKTGIVAGLAAVGVSALSAGAALSGLWAMIQTGRAEIDNLAKSGRQIGMSLQQLRELKYITDLSGVDWGTAEASLIRMNKNLGELRTGTGAYGKLLAKTDPALARQLKRTKSTSEAFTILHKRMSKIEDPAKRTAFLMKHFGKSGVEIGKLKMSTEDFVEQLEKARRIKGILPDDAGDRAELFGDTLDEVHMAIQGVADAIGYQLFPAATDTAAAFRDWIADNREFIATGVADFIRDIGDAIRKVDWEEFGRDARDVALAIRDVFNAVGGVKGVLIGLGIAIGAGPAVAIAGLASNILLLGSAVLGIPAGAFLALAGAGVAIYRDWGNVSEALGKARDAIAGLFTAGSFSEFLAALHDVETTIDGVATAVRDALFKGVLDAVEAVFGAGGRDAAIKWLAFLDKLPSLAGEKLVAMYEAIDAKWQEFTAQVRASAAAFGQAIYDGIAGAIGGLVDYVGGILDGIVAKIRAVMSYIPGLGAAANDAGAKAAGSIAGDAIGKAFNAPIPNKPLAPGPQSDASGAAGTVKGEARVTVDFRNMPKGVSATASADGGLFKGVDVNRGAAMAQS